ncbi:AAA family ATPase [Ancylomarina longa]|uniref:NadR/Ttd14 AAA domain-containing protein n=1 Tax=Ancylomarina longa TaxID=2487017 RepID=A0A434AVQ4_9BACT|nr:AAA family ATPase [Ancylomarina longa]RUT78542.1 hypothetical protein DLK05_08210 [Ancylomarina longa]
MTVFNNRYIITGGPGSGKSSLLNALIKEGFCGFEEISRIIIREQNKIGGNKLPWQDLEAFADACYNKMLKQLSGCYDDRNYFFDRGLPDIIAYMKRGGLTIPQKYYRSCKDYNNIVFLAPPWNDIFINDTERPESFEDANEIYKFIKETYTDLQFEVIELPKISIPGRVQFIIDQLSDDKDLLSDK